MYVSQSPSLLLLIQKSNFGGFLQHEQCSTLNRPKLATHHTDGSSSSKQHSRSNRSSCSNVRYVSHILKQVIIACIHRWFSALTHEVPAVRVSFKKLKFRYI